VDRRPISWTSFALALGLSRPTRLCGATDALTHRVEAGTILRVAHFGPVPSVSDAQTASRGLMT